MDRLLDSAAALWRDAVALRANAAEHAVGDVTISVAGVDDLAVLKLLAVRDQDLVDLLLLAAGDLSVDAVVRSAEHDDIERGISAGAPSGASRTAHGPAPGALPADTLA